MFFKMALKEVKIYIEFFSQYAFQNNQSPPDWLTTKNRVLTAGDMATGSGVSSPILHLLRGRTVLKLRISLWRDTLREWEERETGAKLCSGGGVIQPDVGMWQRGTRWEQNLMSCGTASPIVSHVLLGKGKDATRSCQNHLWIWRSKMTWGNN